MSKVVAEDICDNIREVCRSRDPDTDEGRSFVRVKVVVNITLPLSRGRGVTLESARELGYGLMMNGCLTCVIGAEEHYQQRTNSLDHLSRLLHSFLPEIMLSWCLVFMRIKIEGQIVVQMF